MRVPCHKKAGCINGVQSVGHVSLFLRASLLSHLESADARPSETEAQHKCRTNAVKTALTLPIKPGCGMFFDWCQYPQRFKDLDNPFQILQQVFCCPPD